MARSPELSRSRESVADGLAPAASGLERSEIWSDLDYRVR